MQLVSWPKPWADCDELGCLSARHCNFGRRCKRVFGTRIVFHWRASQGCYCRQTERSGEHDCVAVTAGAVPVAVAFDVWRFRRPAKVLRLCEKRLTFMVFELCNLHQHEAVLVAKFQVQMLERIELLKTSSIYCYALFGLAWAQGCQPDAIETALGEC